MFSKESMNPVTSYGLATLSGLLLLICFPPFNYGSFLAWFAIVPLFISVYNEKNVKIIQRLVMLSGLFIAPLFLWFRWELDIFLPSTIAWLLSIWIAFAMGQFVLWYVKDYWKPKNLPRGKLSYLPDSVNILLIPVLGTTVEFLAMNVPLLMKIGGAFGYFSISRTQWLNVPILQLASFTGMYGVTFLILLVNSALAYLLLKYMEKRELSKQALLVLLVFAVVFASSWFRISSIASGDVTIVIIQTKPDVMETKQVNELYAGLTASALRYEPDIVLWSFWVDYDKGELVGPSVEDFTGLCKQNNFFLIGVGEIVFPDGHIEYYEHKYHFHNILDGIIPLDFDLIIPNMKGVETSIGKIGMLLCMESCSTIPARKLVQDGTQFITVTSADRPVLGSFPGLIGGNLAYISVEYGVYTALFFESEGSILVDPCGRILNDISPEKEIVVGEMSFFNKQTFYESFGDVFGWVTVVLTASLLAYNHHLKENSTMKYCENCRAEMNKDATICSECEPKKRRKFF